MRSQNRLALVSFSLALFLTPIALIPFAAAIPNPIDNGRGHKADLPDAPATPPPPPGRRQPGGSLSGEQAVCPERPQALTAITPVDVHGKTLSEHPTFWFYTPYTADEVQSGEFSILTRNEDQRIYETSFILPEQPGLVSVTLPDDGSVNLEAGQYYHWYLSLSCVSATEAKTNLNIDGWVQRLEPTPELEVQVGNPSSDIWYDVVDNLAIQMQTSPDENETELEQAWVELLNSVDLSEFIQKPIIGPVLLTDD